MKQARFGDKSVTKVKDSRPLLSSLSEAQPTSPERAGGSCDSGSSYHLRAFAVRLRRHSSGARNPALRAEARSSDTDSVAHRVEYGHYGGGQPRHLFGRQDYRLANAA